MSIQLLTNKPWANLGEWLINLLPMMNSHPPSCVCVCVFFSTGGADSSTRGWFNSLNCGGSTLVNDYFRGFSNVTWLQGSFMFPYIESRYVRICPVAPVPPLAPLQVEVHDLELLDFERLGFSLVFHCSRFGSGDDPRPPHFTLRVRCGGGLYVCF